MHRSSGVGCFSAALLACACGAGAAASGDGSAEQSRTDVERQAPDGAAAAAADSASVDGVVDEQAPTGGTGGPDSAAEVASTASPTAETPEHAEPAAAEAPEDLEPAGTDFIHWRELTSLGASNPLPDILDLRSAAYHPGYEGEELVVSFSTADDDNGVIIVDVDGRTYRDLWLHVACGDCVVGSSLVGSLIATQTALWESTDGGYRYAQIAEWDFGEASAPERIEQRGGALLVKGPWGWLSPTRDQLGHTLHDWPSYAVSVEQDSALEFTARYVTIYGSDGQLHDANVCVFGGGFNFGAAWHSGTAVVTLCGNQDIGYTPNLGEQGFVNIGLGAEPRWVGSLFDLEAELRALQTTMETTAVEPVPREAVIATDAGWHHFHAREQRFVELARQAPSPEAEVVFDYVIDHGEGRGLRISNRGIGVATFSPR